MIKLRKPLNSPCDVSPSIIWSLETGWGFLFPPLGYLLTITGLLLYRSRLISDYLIIYPPFIELFSLLFVTFRLNFSYRGGL
nr:MAG TPA: hypothetical protein [Bacteriophage sp.]